MMASSPRRGRYRKRLASPRFSSDSSVTTLPAYTSPPWSKLPDLHGEISDRPPDYPDSAEEGDADTEDEERQSTAFAPLSPPPGSLPPRRPRKHLRRSSTSHTRRLHTASDDPYLDSLLARSVHALEMSNALLQSSMSTQSSLNAVLASDSTADRTLEARAQMLSSRIDDRDDVRSHWMEDLAHISKSVENLIGDEIEDEVAPEDSVSSVSQSLPATSGFAEHVRLRGKHMRRPSLDLHDPSSETPSLRHASSQSQLEFTNHQRSHFVKPAPRPLTMYIDATDDPDLIALPSTLGLRQPGPSYVPAPLPSAPSSTFLPVSASEPVLPPIAEPAVRAIDLLSSYVGRPSPSRPSTSSSSTSRLPAHPRSTRRSSSASSHTTRRPRLSHSPPSTSSAAAGASPTLSASKRDIRSRSLTPLRTTSPQRYPRPMTPPIEELSSASESSGTMHVDRTVESLRHILEKQRAASEASAIYAPAPPPRPSFLRPPPIAPIMGTSHATASVSRLFTKGRHSSSTRPPSPPPHSSLKRSSAPPTPSIATPTTPLSAVPSSSSSMLSIPDMFGTGFPGLAPRARSDTSHSGRSTPKRISFAELPEPYSWSKPEGATFKGKTRAKGKSKSGKGKGKDEDAVGWWPGWLLGAGSEGASGLNLGAIREERFARGSWGIRSGYGGSLEEWGA